MDANALKQKGNDAFAAKDYASAVAAFSEAIKLDSSNHVLFSNRSGAYAAQQNWAEAEADARTCLQLKSDWPKGHQRLGAALHGAKRFEESIKAYNDGLALDPNNQSIKDALDVVTRDKNASSSRPHGDPMAQMLAKAFSPDCLAKIQQHPKLAPLPHAA